MFPRVNPPRGQTLVHFLQPWLSLGAAGGYRRKAMAPYEMTLVGIFGAAPFSF